MAVSVIVESIEILPFFSLFTYLPCSVLMHILTGSRNSRKKPLPPGASESALKPSSWKCKYFPFWPVNYVGLYSNLSIEFYRQCINVIQYKDEIYKSTFKVNHSLVSSFHKYGFIWSLVTFKPTWIRRFVSNEALIAL